MSGIACLTANISEQRHKQPQDSCIILYFTALEELVEKDPISAIFRTIMCTYSWQELHDRDNMTLHIFQTEHFVMRKQKLN